MSRFAAAKPINLTEAAGQMSWSDVERFLYVGAGTDGMALEIRALDCTTDGHSNDGLVDTVYVIVSGYGLLKYDKKSMECTEHDVLFVPSGHPHRFERLDGEIRIWRIALIRTHTSH